MLKWIHWLASFLSITSTGTCMCFLCINLLFCLRSQPHAQALGRNFSIWSPGSSHCTTNSDTGLVKCNCQNLATIILCFLWCVKTTYHLSTSTTESTQHLTQSFCFLPGKTSKLSSHYSPLSSFQNKLYSCFSV